MNRKSKDIFKIKNGRRFQFALIKAAYGDSNVCKMFRDNFDADRKNIVINDIINGSFGAALFDAFIWKDSNEKEKFWREIYLNFKDYVPEPVKK